MLIRGWELKKYFCGGEWGGGGGRLFEAGGLLTFSTFRVGAYSRLGLKRINTVINKVVKME